ncbi:MAG: YceI family protein [Chlamydiae bacterium]|nr:YceI family protein [Chlamydiota bacterium]MBI3266871.1 YceI family protein [Chlamydiota bacterium]
MKKIFLSVLFFLVGALSYGQVENYVIDPVHSSVTFKIRHFFSKVTGDFDQFEGAITVNLDNMEANRVQASIETASINTRNEKRDHHLQSPDFFDAAQFPKIIFQSKKWKKVGDSQYEVTGDLSMHGVTKEVVLSVKSTGFGKGMNDIDISGWEASTTVKKSDFGMTYGGATLGDDVEITIDIESHKV